MSNTTKNITSQAAVAYAQKELTPIVDKLNTLSENATSQNKLLAYHVFETCLLAEGEKVTHAMLEAAINKPFDKRVSSMGRKVADYVMNKKSHRGQVLKASQFRAATKDNGEIIVPAELHVSTVAGQIGHDNAERNKERKKAKSCVEQALDAAGLPIELADKQIKLAQDGNDAAMAFVKSAMEKFTPAQKESVSESVTTPMTPEQTLTAALDVLIDMAPEQASQWLTDAIELLGLNETVTEEVTIYEKAA